jgi:tRNA threonylcarbamoyladenosine biosynthesis protein TsaE
MPVLEPLSFEVISHSDEQTQRIGAKLGALLPLPLRDQPSIIALQGPMGAGKTNFAKGVGAGWGADQALRSPTFTLVQAHHRAQDQATLYHIDLYRAESAAALHSLGLGEILEESNAVCLIEWPDRILDTLPPETLRIKLAIASETKRQLTFATQSTQTWQVLLTFRKSVYGV